MFMMSQMLFIYIDSDQEENKRVMEFFGLTVADAPTYRVIKMSENMAKFKPEDDLSAEAVTKFAQGVLSGDVKVYYRTTSTWKYLIKNFWKKCF